MGRYRFVHTADIHLDSPLIGLANVDDHVARRIRTATREAFDALVSRSIEEEVDFLIIAGDLYDGDWRDYQTGLFFTRQMGRLKEAGISVFLLYGNHDAESRITRHLQLPDNVKVFSSRRPETFRIDGLGVALHGQSYARPDIEHNLVPSYPEPIPGMLNVGVLHTGLGGRGGHENYAPCTLEDLVHKGYDYWALGHVHGREVIREHPHIVFPGNLQGRHVRETGPKGAVLVEVEDRAIRELSPFDVDIVRWARLDVDVADAERFEDVVDRIRARIERAVREEAGGRLLACRIELLGRTVAHEELVVSTKRLLAETRAAALGLGDEVAWIERVMVATEPARDSAAVSAREDALGELSRMLDAAHEDETLLSKLEEDIGRFADTLPYELRTKTEDRVLEMAVKRNYGALVGEVRAYLLARLAIRD
ncbi:MAG TPA: DNA repair exonuclease [Deltaproteobacteria bacterium]|nr:DNA repair exonuclease [Deltaproteobacteria bacterium]